MVNLVDLVNIAGIPALGAASEAVLKMYDTVDQVKVHKQRCKHLRNQCVETLNALKDKSTRVEGSTELQEALDVFETKVHKIHHKMEEWASLSLVKSVIRQSEISTGLEELFRDLHFCSERFQMAGTVELTRLAQESRLIQERDAADLREQLLQLVRKTDSLKQLLIDTGDVEQLMQTLQEEIQSEPVSAGGVEAEAEVDRDNLDLQAGLYFLHKEADVLPPITDLTPEIEKVSEHAVTHGGDNDVYIGRWLGQEMVALKFTRGCNHSETAKKKFFNEVSIWRQLQHPNIVRLYGTATFGGFIYTVSPWMDNGDATQFLAHNPDHDRLQLLLEVAQGLQYLHNHGVAHGDVRCANVLISRSRVARLSDFGLSVLIYGIAEAAGASVDPSTQEPNLGGLRWRAPELIDPPSGSRPIITPATDIWSFGMLCLEVMTGERPFHGMGMSDVAIMKAIADRNLPPRPSHTYPGLDDHLWNTMQACRQRDAERRPSMQQVVNRLRNTTAMKTPSEVSSSPSTITSPLPITPPENKHRTLTASFISTSSILSEPPLQFPRMPDKDGTEPPSPGLASVASASVSERSNVSQIPWSFATSREVNGGSKPASQRPLTRFISTPTQPLLVPPRRTETAPPTQLSTSLNSASPSGILTANPRPTRSNYSPGSPGDGRRQSNLFLERKPSRPTRNPSRPPPDSRPIVEDSEISGSSRQISESQGHIEFGIPEEPHLLRFADDGSVRCGSVPALVHRLLIETESLVENIQFRDSFLTCYTAFMTAEDLFKSLLASYKTVEEGSSKEETVQIRYRILTVIRAWLGRHRAFPKDTALVQEIRDFAERITAPHTIKKAAEQVLDVVRTKEIEIIRPRRYDKAHSSKLYDGFRASVAQPRQFAIGFTIMAWDMYSDLLPSDFIAWLMESNTLGGREFIESHMSIWHKISHWTKNLILQPEKENARTARLTLFISIANECRKLHNYPCMNAIVAGCNSPLVKRLRYTFGDLEKNAKEALDAMVRLGEYRDSYRNYRIELDHYGHQVPLIPDLVAVHAKDIRSLWEAKVGLVYIAGERLVNFERYILLTDMINQILSYQRLPIDLERFRESGPLAYLECQLDKFQVTEEVLRCIQARSEKLQRAEEIAYKGRYREVRAAGFAPPAPKGKK